MVDLHSGVASVACAAPCPWKEDLPRASTPHPPGTAVFGDTQGIFLLRNEFRV